MRSEYGGHSKIEIATPLKRRLNDILRLHRPPFRGGRKHPVVLPAMCVCEIIYCDRPSRTAGCRLVQSRATSRALRLQAEIACKSYKLNFRLRIGPIIASLTRNTMNTDTHKHRRHPENIPCVSREIRY